MCHPIDKEECWHVLMGGQILGGWLGLSMYTSQPQEPAIFKVSQVTRAMTWWTVRDRGARRPTHLSTAPLTLATSSSGLPHLPLQGISCKQRWPNMALPTMTAPHSADLFHQKGGRHSHPSHGRWWQPPPHSPDHFLSHQMGQSAQWGGDLGEGDQSMVVRSLIQQYHTC